jgi:cytochrome c biogenesis protein
MAVNPGLVRRFSQTIGAVRTGIILLILVGVFSALGTVILQRPLTSPEDIERAYSPQVLRVLDATGLTDMYHAWWYLLLLGLLAISIIFASIERWPNAWRYYSRPYRRTDSSFRAVLPLQRSYPVIDAAEALDATEHVWKKNGLKAERIVEHDEVSLYAEKSRFAVLAVYVVHASLLLIMLGGIVDGLWGFKGYVTLVPGKPATSDIELRDGSVRKLPFAVRCDEAGQENYTGEYAMMPKRWWSKLAVVQNGREVERKEIAVNDPLVYGGVRFYQSGYGTSGEMRGVRLAAVKPHSSEPPESFKLGASETVHLKDGTAISVVKFIPDAFPMDGEIFQRSKDVNNAAIKLEIRKDGKTQAAYLFRSEQAGMGELTLVGPYNAKGEPLTEMPYQFVASADMAPFTGLQVSHEPGQWAVWAGCLLMGVGLVLAFWVLHQRYWAVVVTNKEGRLMLWAGAASNKKRETFDTRFRELADEMEKELNLREQVGELSAV